MPVSASPTAWGLLWGSGSCLAACALPGGQGRSRRRFHALWDKICRRDVLWRAWVAVRPNRALRASTGSPWPTSRSTG